MYYNAIANKSGWKKNKRKCKNEYSYIKGSQIITIKPINDRFVHVVTELNHPKKGRTKLLRTLYWSGVESVFYDPRVHTDYGKIIKK